MSTFVFANFFQSTLAAAVTSSQTTISVASASGVPTIGTGQQWAIVVQSASTQTAREVMYVTAISGTTFTVTRGQEGTSAQTWSIGDNVFGGNTAGQMGMLVQVPQMTDASISPVFGAVGGALGTFSGGVDATGQDAGGANFRATNGSYGMMIHNDGSSVYFLQTSFDVPFGSFNSFRPFTWDLSTGYVTIDGTGVGSSFGGAVTMSALTCTTISASGFADMANGLEVSGGTFTIGGVLSAPTNATPTFTGSVTVAGVLSSGSVSTGAINGASLAISGAGSVGTSFQTNDGSITAVQGRLRATYGARGAGDLNAAALLLDWVIADPSYWYRISPDGFIIQGGIVILGANTLVTINLPTAFPNAAIAIVVSYESNIPAANGSVGATMPNNSQATFYNANGSGGTNGCQWLAIGH